MPLRPQQEELANEFVKLTGETEAEGVPQAPSERLERDRMIGAKRRLADELDEVALHCAAIPVRDKRSANEIVGYDENGLPQPR